MKYFFTLGKHPELSRAEITAVFSRLSFDWQKILSNDSILIIETENLIKPDFINQFGGVIKFGQIIETKTTLPSADDLAKLIKYQGDKKLYFGISVYNGNVDINKLGLSIKKVKKQENKKSRLVTSKENPLSSVVVEKNNLTKENGFEFILIFDNKQIHIGKTLSVQDFEKYSKIDYGRPKRDKIAGMLPPKIAQIMVNLAQANHNNAILDPFCGSGTILQMAAVLGYKNLIGLDKNSQATEDTEINLNWLQHNLKLDFNFKTTEIDVRNLSKEIKPESIKTIITEPYLGPPLKGSESDSQINEIIKSLTQLYIKTFEQFNLILEDNAQVIIIFPQFRIRDKIYQFNLDSEISKHFKIINKWQYSRPNQRIIREIYQLQK